MQGLKQVILIRKDLKMRRGKEVAQGSHASMEFVMSRIRQHLHENNPTQIELTTKEQAWITGGMAKVCLQVNSEEHLLDLHKSALDRGLESHLIRDSGKTEFGGVKTLTACAIGPDESEAIDHVTGKLSLY